MRVQLKWDPVKSTPNAVCDTLTHEPLGFSPKRAGRRAASIRRRTQIGKWYNLGAFPSAQAESIRESLESVLRVRLRP
jgi:hypothetical protein